MKKEITLIIFFLIYSYLNCQNLISNGDFEIYKKNFIFSTNENDISNFSGEGTGKRFSIDSFVSSWSSLFGAPQYNNKTIRSIWGAYGGLRYDSLPSAFKNNGCIWWFSKIQTYDTINKTIDTVFNVQRNRYEFLGINYSGVFQKLEIPLIKDSTYIISIRHKTGSEFRNKNNLFAAMLSNIAITTTTYNASKPLVSQFSFNNLNLILDDNILDTSFKWRLLKNKFKADSAYQYINIFRYVDAVNSKIKRFFYPKCEVESFNILGQKGYIYYTSTFIDDIRLLPVWQFLDVPSEIEACENDSIELSVLNGSGPYSWILFSEPSKIVSTTKSIKIKILDSNLMYQVMSPYDTAIIPIYVKKRNYNLDTIKSTICENNPLKISNAKIYLWNDAKTDTLRFLDKTGFYWYETKNNCEIYRTNIILTVKNIPKDTIKAQTCNTYKFGDSIYSKSGIYTHKFTAKNGCDSLSTLILDSKEINAKIKLENGIYYTALTPNASYQWYYCYPWRRITNAQYQTFSTITKGSYAVVVSHLGCTDTSDCIALYSSGLQSLQDNEIIVYPNPTKDIITIKIGNDFIENQIEVYNSIGQTIKSITTKSNEIQVDLKNEAKGIYLIKVNEFNIFKILKE